MSSSWLTNHPDQKRLFTVMLEIELEYDFHRRETVKLSPRFDEVAFGGGHFEALVKAEAAREFLSGLRAGLTPGKAAAGAKVLVREMVARWNRQPGGLTIWGKYELERWPGTADTQVEWYERRVLATILPVVVGDGCEESTGGRTS